MWYEEPWPGGRNSVLAQLIPTSLWDLGPTSPIPDLSLPIGTRREVGRSLGLYSQRACSALVLAQVSMSNSSHWVCLVQNCLLHQTWTFRVGGGGVLGRG